MITCEYRLVMHCMDDFGDSNNLPTIELCEVFFDEHTKALGFCPVSGTDFIAVCPRNPDEHIAHLKETIQEIFAGSTKPTLFYPQDFQFTPVDKHDKNSRQSN